MDKCPKCGAKAEGIVRYSCGSSQMDAARSPGCRIRELEDALKAEQDRNAELQEKIDRLTLLVEETA